ncbi:MAG: hypothetical protein AAF517_27165, partial [Planctomycetota bacterium]
MNLRALFSVVVASAMFLSSCGGGSSEPSESGASGSSGGIAGTYQNDALKLVLETAGDGFTGSVTLDGATYPVKASGSGTALTGSFESQGQQFDFSASLDGTKLSFETAGSKYALTKKVVKNPLAGGKNPLANSNPLAKGDSSAKSNPLAGGGESGGGKTANADRIDATDAAKKQADQTAAEARANSAPALTKNFKHPAGFFFQYPGEWQMKAAGQG